MAQDRRPQGRLLGGSLDEDDRRRRTSRCNVQRAGVLQRGREDAPPTYPLQNAPAAAADGRRGRGVLSGLAAASPSNQQRHLHGVKRPDPSPLPEPPRSSSCGSYGSRHRTCCMRPQPGRVLPMLGPPKARHLDRAVLVSLETLVPPGPFLPPPGARARPRFVRERVASATPGRAAEPRPRRVLQTAAHLVLRGAALRASADRDGQPTPGAPLVPRLRAGRAAARPLQPDASGSGWGSPSSSASSSTW